MQYFIIPPGGHFLSTKYICNSCAVALTLIQNKCNILVRNHSDQICAQTVRGVWNSSLIQRYRGLELSWEPLYRPRSRSVYEIQARMTRDDRVVPVPVGRSSGCQQDCSICWHFHCPQSNVGALHGTITHLRTGPIIFVFAKTKGVYSIFC